MVSSGWGPGMLLKSLQCIRTAPDSKCHWSKFEKPELGDVAGDILGVYTRICFIALVCCISLFQCLFTLRFVGMWKIMAVQ